MGSGTPAGNKAKAAVSVDQAKIYYCSAFLLRPGRGSEARGSHEYDIVSGGDNGYLYLWVEGVCARTVRASRGAIRCIKVRVIVTDDSNTNTVVFRWCMSCIGGYGHAFS
jgi:hypothetical protein